MEDWGCQENYVWIYIHSKEIGSSGVLLATATQQDCGFQMYQIKLNREFLKTLCDAIFTMFL